MKKLTFTLLIATLFSVASVFAQGGTTGPLTWNIENGTLTISGEGDMPDYDIYPDTAPWSEYNLSIHTVVIETGVSSIGAWGFDGCLMALIIIPNSVINIGHHAFFGCESLTSITIPNSVISIEYYAFFGCESLTSITIPNSVTAIGSSAFFECKNLTLVTLSNSLTSIEDFVFCRCTNLTSITIPNSITTIKEWAFASCTNLVSITIPNSVTTIGDWAFGTCTSLISITIPNSVTTIGSSAFHGCTSLTSATILNGVTSIEKGAFSFCTSLASIIIPNSITNIRDNVFLYCRSLTSITIPSSVTSIGNGAFSICNSLTTITNLNPVPITIDPDVFNGMDVSTCTLKVSISSVKAYQNTDVWKEFKVVGGDYYVQVSVNDSKYGYAIGNELYPINATAIVTATANSGYHFVNWIIDGVEISRDNPYSFTVTEDVELVANFEEGVGIVETDNEPSLQVYPNPTTGQLRITNCELRITGIEIFDVFGRSVKAISPSFGGGWGEALDISDLPSGIYFVRIQTEAGMVTRKVVKN